MYGLGVLWKMGSDGKPIDCDAWGNFFQSVCWVPDIFASPTQQPLDVQAVTNPQTGATTWQPIIPNTSANPYPVASAVASTVISSTLVLGVAAVAAVVVISRLRA